MHYYTEQVLVYMCFLERERRVERAWCLLNASSNTQVSASTYYMNSVHSTLCYAAKIPYYFFLYFCRKYLYNIFFFSKLISHSFCYPVYRFCNTHSYFIYFIIMYQKKHLKKKMFMVCNNISSSYSYFGILLMMIMMKYHIITAIVCSGKCNQN